MRDFHTQLPLDGLLDFQQSGIAVLHYLAGVEIHKMVVLAELVRTLVLCAVVAELVLDYQIAVQQQLDGVVQGGTAHTVFAVFHLVVEILDVEMPVGTVDLLQDGKTLRGLAKMMVVKVFGEYLFDSQCNCFVGFFHI